MLFFFFMWTKREIQMKREIDESPIYSLFDVAVVMTKCQRQGDLFTAIDAEQGSR